MKHLKLSLFVILACCLFLPLAAASGCNFLTQTQGVSVQSQLANLINEGNALSKAGNYDAAIAKFDEALKIDSNYALAYAARGVAYHRQKQYERAIADYTIAIGLDAQDDNTYYNRGLAYEASKQAAQAIADFNKAISIAKDPSVTQQATAELKKISQASTTSVITTTPITTTTTTIIKNPLIIDTRWTLSDAYIVVNADGTTDYVVSPQTLMAYGGTPLSAYTWGKPAMGRFPPAGTIIDPNGVFRGNGGALTEGTYIFDVQVSDGSKTATAALQISIRKIVNKPGDIPTPAPTAVFQQPLVNAIPLVNGIAGEYYASSLYVTGGTPPYSWAIDPAYEKNFALSGLSIDKAGGIVRGTIGPALSGQTIEFKVMVKDNTGAVAIGDTVYSILVK
jgi:hypothetical protein